MASIVPGRHPAARRVRGGLALVAAGLMATSLPAAADTITLTGCLIPGIDDRCEAWEDQFNAEIRETPTDIPGSWTIRSVDWTTGGVVANGGERAFTFGENVDWPSACTDPSGTWLTSRYQVVAYDVSSGTRLWDMQVPAPDCSWFALPSAAAVSADDSTVFVTGFVTRGIEEADVFVVAFDAVTGEEKWNVTYDGPAGKQDDSFAIATSPIDDRVFVVAAAQASDDAVVRYGGSALYSAREMSAWINRDVDVKLLTLDGGTGELLDVSTHAGPSYFVDGTQYGSWDFATDIVVDPSGEGLAILATSDGRSSYRDIKSHLAVVRFEADGDGWSKSWAQELPGAPLGLAVAGDRYIVSGVVTDGVTEKAPYAISALGAEDGSTLWSTVYDVGGTSGAPRELRVDPARGRVFALGLETSRGGAASVLTLSADSGGKLWTSVFRDPRTTATMIFNYDNDDMPHFAVDPASGNVKVVHIRDQHFRTVSLDGATGAIGWTALYHFPEREQGPERLQEFPYPKSVGVTAGGNTVIFGTVYVQLRDWCRISMFGYTLPSTCSRDDFLTISYQG